VTRGTLQSGDLIGPSDVILGQALKSLIILNLLLDLRSLIGGNAVGELFAPEETLEHVVRTPFGLGLPFGSREKLFAEGAAAQAIDGLHLLQHGGASLDQGVNLSVHGLYCIHTDTIRKRKTNAGASFLNPGYSGVTHPHGARVCGCGCIFYRLAAPPRPAYNRGMCNDPNARPVVNLLVIGYGNTLRGDDGVGPRVAEAVGARGLPDVRTLVAPMLTPELAEPIAQARVVIFVDAAVDAPREVRFRPLSPADSSQLMAHAADPRTMLALARDVFGHAPEAWWLTIPVTDLAFRETLSPDGEQGCRDAVEAIQEFHSRLDGKHSG
jgi:hydrogenase maturation protease